MVEEPLVEEEEGSAEDDADEATDGEDTTPTEGSGKESAQAPAKDPDFPENASVSQAIEAVPQGTERQNLDPEALGRPLQDPAVYEPCKIGNQHFKIRVAIWNGKAVGIDVDAKNKNLADCIRTQVQGLTWPDKVRSLETVDFSL